jgi:hypothetical protein
MGQAGFGVQLLLDSNTFGCRSGLVMPRGDSYQLQGQQGGEVLAAGQTGVNGPYRWIQILQDTVLEGITAPNLTNAASLTSTTLPAGIGIGGSITELEVLTGLVIAYYA